MKQHRIQPVGFRTIKTALAALLVLTVCDLVGQMDYVLALIGVYCAMERTIAESWMGCLNQFFGVLLGSALGFLLLLVVPAPPGWLMALCLVAVIWLCNALGISYAAFLTSTIFVSVCSGSATAYDILCRVRDVSLGLAAGLCVNLFIHPYSGAPRVYEGIRQLQKQALSCVEAAALYGRYASLDECRNTVLALRREWLAARNQDKAPFLRKKHGQELALLDGCMQLAGRMAQEAEAICSMDELAAPSEENYRRLLALGLRAPEEGRMENGGGAAAVLNYHLDCFLRAYVCLNELLPPQAGAERAADQAAGPAAEQDPPAARNETAEEPESGTEG